MNRKPFIKKLLLVFGGILLSEVLFRLIVDMSLSDVVLFRVVLFDLKISLIAVFLFSIFNEKATNILIVLFSFILSIYTITEITFKNLTGSYMSLKASSDGLGRTIVLLKEFVSSMKPNFFLMLIPPVLTLIIILLIKKTRKKRKISLVILTMASIVLLHFLSLQLLEYKGFEKTFQIESDIDVYTYLDYQEISITRLGIIPFLMRDISLIIFPKERILEVEYIEEEQDEPEEISLIRKIDDTKWEEAIENETDATIKTLDQYYINKKITNKNEHTGIFKDKNIVYIMVEAFDMASINEELTPTLYKMATKGWYFDNFYSPPFSCATGESEFIGLTSILPISTTCTPNTYRDNSYPHAILNLFAKKDYFNTSYHNYIDRYYDRAIFHPNLGSSAYYNSDTPNFDIDIIRGWPSDENLFDEATKVFLNQEERPFASFVITSSMHFPYDIDSSISKEYWNEVTELDAPDKIKRYLTKAIDFDKGLELLIDNLTLKNELDDTVIILFGDHHPLHMEYSYLDQFSEIDRQKWKNIDRLPMIIYSTQIEPKTISTVASTFDLVPTIANLFDLDYDPRFYVGNDIFSEEANHYAIFSSGSWIDETGYFNASEGVFNSLGEEIDSLKIENMNKYISNLFDITKATLSTNYFENRIFDNYPDEEPEEVEIPEEVEETE